MPRSKYSVITVIIGPSGNSPALWTSQSMKWSAESAVSWYLFCTVFFVAIQLILTQIYIGRHGGHYHVDLSHLVGRHGDHYHVDLSHLIGRHGGHYHVDLSHLIGRHGGHYHVDLSHLIGRHGGHYHVDLSHLLLFMRERNRSKFTAAFLHWA